MKKLLSMLAVSTLVGTIASNSKPVFTNTIVSHGLKLHQVSNKDISIENQNSSNPFINTLINDIKTKIIKIAPDGTIWVGTEKGLWKSTDGTNFEQVQGFNYVIYDISFAPDGTIWISASGIYKSTDGNNFSKMSGDVNVLKFEITPDGTIWK